MADDSIVDHPSALGALPDRIRHRFPIFERLVYLNSCSQGALSDAVLAAYAAYLRDWEEHGSPWELWVERAEEARASFAALVGVDPDDVAVTTSLSAGVSALVSGLRLEPARAKIVVSDFEFPTVGQILHAQEQRGWRVVHVPEERDGTIPLERFEELVDEETALVAVTAVCYRNGARLDVEGVVRLARDHGAHVLLDAYQAAGAIPLQARALDVDFLAAGCVKYLLGSAGVAFLYCRRELVERIAPTATGWFADEDVFAMDVHDYSPSTTARRFESGTPPVPAIYAGLAGMQLMKEIGIAETERHVRALSASLIDGVEALGGRLAGPRDPSRRGPLVAVASTDEQALVDVLAREGIVTSSRDGNVRISLHCYNSAEDVEAVLEALAKQRKLLA
jgi:selenocysteine lyase/cysteine desulfurase